MARGGRALARAFWPGPLTLVLNQGRDHPRRGHRRQGHRRGARARRQGRSRPDRTVGQPIAAPSANRSNRLSPTRAEHVLADLDGRIDLVIDSGPTAIGLESTVLDLTTAPPRLLRPGPIATARARDGTRRPVSRRACRGRVDRPAPSPGQMPVHYAPGPRRFASKRPRSWRDLVDRKDAAWSSWASQDRPHAPATDRRIRLEIAGGGRAAALR